MWLPVLRNEVHVSRPAVRLSVGCFIFHRCVASALTEIVADPLSARVHNFLISGIANAHTHNFQISLINSVTSLHVL